MRAFTFAIAVLALLPGIASADVEAEIEYLVSAVGASECTFIRNGTRHTAEAAEDHLRMKYRRGGRYASTAEDFIRYLASASSWTKRPYYIECADRQAVPTGEWLRSRLDEYRDRRAASR